MQLCFTVDWEDWFHGLELPEEARKKVERRIKIGHDILLNKLAKHRISATFFLVGEMMEEFPELVTEIIQAGHEVGCHTYSHYNLTKISKENLSNEIEKCKALIKTHGLSYRGFRAPFFSITKKNTWALPLLSKQGFVYDSSIFPGNTFRTGIVNAEKNIYHFDDGLIEFPISNFKFTALDVGVGGAYFRIAPYKFFATHLKKIIDKRDALFYFHPWELDPGQPHLKGIKHRNVHTHYAFLDKTEKKLEQLFNEFEFAPMQNIIQQYIQRGA
jgi:polysaccharide deacetylase family protein (PEP-CTERM system associated)